MRPFGDRAVIIETKVKKGMVTAQRVAAQTWCFFLCIEPQCLR